MPISDQQRAAWVAELAMEYEQQMTSADRLKLLMRFFDQAHHFGMLDGIDSLRDRLAGTSVAHLIPRQAG